MIPSYNKFEISGQTSLEDNGGAGGPQRVFIILS